jgi:YidC/Oxa1 family membrane protein insertase
MPLDMDLLKSYDKNFDEILPLGWSFIGSLNRHVFMPMYNLLSSWGLAAGWAIFWMTIIVKLILSPVMFKQHKLSAMMKVIRPEIDEVNAKFKDADPMKKQQETMAVYRKAGVNQMAGCFRPWFRSRCSTHYSDSSRICWILGEKASGSYRI